MEKNEKKSKTTTGQFDKVFKENAEDIYASLIKALLQIDTSMAENVPQSDLQYTLERKADFLKKILPKGLPAYILHIEIQSANDLEMLERMLLYYALAYKTYKIKIVQFVIYIGNEDLTMRSHLAEENMAFSYQIIDIRRYDYEQFLQASTPEEVILAILGNFHGEQPEKVIAQILTRLQELTQTPLALGKYTTQLNIISKLRKLQKPTLNQIKSMPVVLDYTDTLAYQEGEAKGEAKSIVKMLQNGFTPQQVTDILAVPLDYVKELEKSLPAK